MWELRWILAGLGVALVAGVYFWGHFSTSRKRAPIADAACRRSEPRISDSEPTDADLAVDVPAQPKPEYAVEPESVPASESEAPEPELAFEDAPAPETQRIEKIIALRLIPRAEELSAERAVSALQEAGLRHGRYGIFHQDGSAFSVASLVEPGSFDLGELEDTTLPGMSFFMLLPGTGDPVARFDAMVQAARVIAVELNSELFDDQGSSWSIQRERYVREELIAYRHRHSIH